MKYVIKIGELGYFGDKPWTPVPREEAIVFDTMKKARRQQNRLNDRLMKDQRSEIEPAK
jgi:hypothetical protein